MKVNWTAVLLGISLVTLAAIALQAHSATSRHRATALSLLGDYADFAAFNYSGRATEVLHHVGRHLLIPARHADHVRDELAGLRLPSLAEMNQHKEMCDCAGAPAVNARAYVLYSGALDSLATTGPVSTSEAAAIRAEIRAHPAEGGPEAFMMRPLPGGERMIVYQPVHGGSDRTVVFGTVFDVAELGKALKQVCTSNLLPASLVRRAPSDSLMTLAFFVPGKQQPILSSVPEPQWFEAREDTLPARYGGIIARASIRQEMAPLLIIGGLPRSRLPQLLVLFAISAALAVLAAVQTRRERALMRMRENFVTSVSHELRTPLAQVRLFLETLRMGRASSAAEREWALSHIERETTRLAHLVENVLHVSRPKRTEMVAAPVIDLDAEIREIADSFQPIARSRRARIVTRIESGLQAAIRREHLRQITINLLDNAVKYGPTGQTVTVESSTTPDHVRIAVRDEGPGVLPAERERIWAPYYRGSTAEALASGGTGIGLSIVRDLVGTYGGRVFLEPGETGATFVVELPRMRVGPRADVVGRSSAASAG